MPTPTFSYDDPVNKTFSPETRQAIVDHLYELTEEYSIETYPAEHRNHLGASVIGDDCSRKVWYSFRWVKLEQHEPRMRRLFDTGKREEARFQELLTWMGFFVREIDPATDRQYRFSAVNGHYGGSGDSVALLPWFRKDDDIRILAEYKTHNKKWFEDLKAKKLRLSKPQHYDQMCAYGKEFKTRYGLYCAKNKDTDEYYFEFVELDWNRATELENKARDIITAKFPPARIADNPSFWKCKFCFAVDICHHGETVEKNCRSCKMAVPVENSEWFCNRFNDIIPKDFIATGCPDHQSVNE